MIENVAVAEPKLAEEFETEEQALADLRARALELVRQTVDPRTWEMFWEFAVESRPASEVAKKFGVSDAGVRMAAGRIRKRLRDLMIDGE
jgi:RNA polymerase sigma-70 factor (ECF subfamily)